MYDVHIIGAGPAGSIAAISATRKNANTLVSEEDSHAGLPVHCSGLFSKTGLESLREFIDYRKTIKNNIYGAIIDFAGERIGIKAKEPVAYVCDRADFDARLADNAENEGAKIEYGKKIRGTYAAENVIGADGPFSNVAVQFTFPRIMQYVSTVQAYIKYTSETPRQAEVFISNKDFPGFFAWVIPHNEELAEFGVGVALPNNVSKAWQALLKLKNVRYAGKVHGAVIPIDVRRRAAARIGKRNVLLVGDAAGQTKSTTGGGVIIGGNCARYAGIHFNSPLRYELAWRSRFGADLAIHKLVHNYVAGKDELHLQGLAKKLKKLRLDEFLSRNGHMDMPTKMIKPFSLAAHFLKLVV